MPLERSQQNVEGMDFNRGTSAFGLCWWKKDVKIVVDASKAFSLDVLYYPA